MIIRLVSLTAILLFYANCGTGSDCEQEISSSYLDAAVDFINKAKSNFSSLSTCEREISSYYLDSAVDLITKAKSKFPSRDSVDYHNNSKFSARDPDNDNSTDKNCAQNYKGGITCEGNRSLNASDCSDWLAMGHNKSGVYTVWPKSRFTRDEPISVYCDMETDKGGWTVIQRRGPFGRRVDYFYKDWESYKEGFGDIEKDFWLGNDNICALTNQKLYSVRFDLKDVENDTRYAHYDTFWIDGEDQKYTLHIANYTGDAGNSMDYHNNSMFSARDQDNDNSNSKDCAQLLKGGWWYNDCYNSNLNGLNLNGKYEADLYNGVIWYSWKGIKESLQSTEIKIRPKSFRLPRVSLDNTPK